MTESPAWKCRITGHPLTPIVDFGLQPLGNGFLTPDQFEQEYFFHMQVGFVQKCKMLQLLEQPHAEQLFHENYAFFRGLLVSWLCILKSFLIVSKRVAI